MYVIIFEGYLGIAGPLFPTERPGFVNLSGRKPKQYTTDGYVCIPLSSDNLPHRDFFSDEDTDIPAYAKKSENLASTWFIIKNSRFYIDTVIKHPKRGLEVSRTEIYVDPDSRYLIPTLAMKQDYRDTMSGIIAQVEDKDEISDTAVRLGLGMISYIQWIPLGALMLLADGSVRDPDYFTDTYAEAVARAPDPDEPEPSGEEVLETPDLVGPDPFISKAVRAYLGIQ